MATFYNPYRYSAGGSSGPATAPMHWWNLDNTTTGIDDQGTGGTGNPWPRLTNNGGVVATGGGPDGQDVLDFGDTDHLILSSRTWQGAQDNLSCSVWANFDALSSTGNWVVNMRDSGSNQLFQILFRNLATDTVRGTVVDSAGDTALLNNSTTAVSASTWYHLAMTWDGTDAKLYQNNVEIDSVTPGNVGAFTGSTIPFVIGAAAWQPTTNITNHDGKVGMVGIWDVALTTDDISTLYNEGNGLQYDGSIWS